MFRTLFLSAHVLAALKDGGVDLAWRNLGLRKDRLRLDSLRRRVVWAVGSSTSVEN